MARREPFVGNARVAEIMRGRPLHERLMMSMMERAFGPELVDDAAKSVSGTTSNVAATIPEAGNLPVSFFIGKDREQLRRELGDDEEKLDAVCQRMEDNGYPVPDNNLAPPTDEEIAVNTAKGRDRAMAALNASKTGGGATPATTTPRAFGEDQFPAEELYHFTDDELRKVEGISDADIVEIRRLQTEAATTPPPGTNPETENTGGAPTLTPPSGGTGGGGTADAPALNADVSGASPLKTGDVETNAPPSGGTGKAGKKTGNA